MEHRVDLKDHLRSRGMNPDLYNVAYDDVERVITFYLYNGAGIVTGYQQYRPDSSSKAMNDPKDSRYYTYLPSGVDGVFGLENLTDDPVIFIVEGIFKAAVLHRLGYNAIAVLTSHPKRLKPWFRILKATRRLIAIGDNDPAGQKLVNTIKAGTKSPVDLDEMLEEDVIKFVEQLKLTRQGHTP